MLREFFVGAYLIVLTLLSVYGLHRVILIYLFLKSKKETTEPAGRFDELPDVTIQLPMFNERYVVERLIESVTRIDYPTEKLEIQVLDDSEDDTRIIAKQMVERKKKEGFDIHYIHRNNRKGFKAGALAEGMKVARGEFIMIFDADFIPQPDILKKTIHYFTDERVALVQTRWLHINTDASILTKVQALMLDGHFIVEHLARSRTGRFFNFNGTAGIWRRKAIEEAGGWEHDTLTEDLDLSFRAQMKGWKFIYVPDVGSPAELPEEINSFKAQQFRWAKGSIQTAKKLLMKVLKADIPLQTKVEGFFHLTNNIAYLLMVPLALLILPTIVLRQEHSVRDALLIDFPLFLGTTCAIGCFYMTTYRVVYGTFKGGGVRLLFLMGVGIGISLNNARAVVEGLIGRESEFVRTPKAGVTAGEKKKRGYKNAMYRSRKSITILFEFLFGSYFLVTLVIAIVRGQVVSIPFLLLFLVGYWYVGIKSILPALKLESNCLPFLKEAG